MKYPKIQNWDKYKSIRTQLDLDGDMFDYEYYTTQEEVRKHIQDCESRHTQQAIYSTFHDGLTQVCFGCKKIRTTLKVREG